MKTPPPPTFLYVYSAKWCAPCRAMKKAKTCESLAKEKGFQYVYVDVDTEDGEPLSDEARITMLPTITVRRDGKELARHEGSASLKDLRAWLEAVKSL